MLGLGSLGKGIALKAYRIGMIPCASDGNDN